MVSPLMCTGVMLPRSKNESLVTVWLPVVIGLFLSVAARLDAGAAWQLSLPQNPKKTRSDFVVRLDYRGMVTGGYQRIRVHVTPRVNPFNTERRLAFALSYGKPGTSDSRVLTVRQTVVLPAGSPGTVETIHVPAGSGYPPSVRVSEDGREHESLRYIGNGRWGGRLSGNLSLPRVLIVDSDTPDGSRRNTWLQTWPADQLQRRSLPDFRNLMKSILGHRWGTANGYYNNRWGAKYASAFLQPTTDAVLLRTVEQHGGLEVLHPVDLPERWIGYSAYDLVFVSFPDLRMLVEQDPVRWRALRTWVATGPALCVYETGTAGKPLARLASLERLLGLSTLVPDEAEEPAFRGWRVPLREDFSRADSPFRLANQTMNSAVEFKYGVVRPIPRPPKSRRRSSSKPVLDMTQIPPDPFADRRSLEERRAAAMFVYRDLSLGRVVALANPEGFPGTPESWWWLFHTLSPRSRGAGVGAFATQRLTWMGRHGAGVTAEYWNWLIPGVGLPPVTTFLVIISLFVIVIGPVNYWLLRRTKRLHLLLVTVPLGAVLVTSTLLLYAIFSDGFGVRSRVRSLTHVDQRAGVAVSWSRQTYYASVAPSQGLVFPSSATVYPIMPGGVSATGQRVVSWGDRQVLSGDYLRSRVARQFLVVNARPASTSLEIDESAQQPLVKNRLGARVLGLLLRDAKGQLFGHVVPTAASDEVVFGDAIAEDAEVRLVPVLDTATRLLELAYQQNRPQQPEGFDLVAYDKAVRSMSRRGYSRSRIDVELFPTSVLESLNRPGWRLAPRSYVALVDREVLSSCGVDNPPEASFHVLTGEW